MSPRLPRARALLRPALAACFSMPLLLLSACGGGGGGGGGGGDSTPAPAVPLAVSASNQQAVAMHALDTATNVEAAQGGAALVTGVQVDAAVAVGTGQRLAQVAQLLASRATRASGQATGVVVTNQPLACSFGGSASVSGSVAAPGVLQAGDTVTIVMDGCVELVDNVSTTLNGSLSLGVVQGTITGVPSFPSHVVLDVTTGNFSLATAAGTLGTNGDMRLDLTQTTATAGTLVLAGSSLTNSTSTAAGTRSTTLKAYAQRADFVDGAGTFRLAALVEARNSRLGTAVSYTIDTPVAVAQTAAGDYTAGSLKVVGANNGSLVVTVTGTNSFQLQLDADGNGTAEATATATLNQLLAVR